MNGWPGWMNRGFGRLNRTPFAPRCRAVNEFGSPKKMRLLRLALRRASNFAAVKLTLNFWLKLLFALALAAGIWWDFSQKQQTEQIWLAFLQNLDAGKWPWLAATIALIPLNWACETLKWHQFVARYEAGFTFWRAYRAVLSGVAFSLFTPNRIGEYGGRILFVKKKNQWKAVIANLVGNFSQMIFLLTAGGLGAAWFMHHFLKTDPLLIQMVVFGAIGLAAGLLFAYFNIDTLAPLARRIPFIHHIKRFLKDLKVLREFTRRELSEILGWSVVRCLIYSTQYLLLLRFFGIETGLAGGYAGVFTLFFVQMSVPLPPVMGLLARGNVALHIWGFFGANEVSILASTLLLWILNLMIPSFLGAIFLFQTNITKSLGYDEPD